MTTFTADTGMTTATAGAPILVVGPEQVLRALRFCCGPVHSINRVDDAFAAIEHLGSQEPGTVFFWAPSLPSRADAALAALRQMRPAARLILLARPDDEPLARNLLPQTLDDYLIWPLRVPDVRRALVGAVATPKSEASDSKSSAAVLPAAASPAPAVRTPNPERRSAMPEPRLAIAASRPATADVLPDLATILPLAESDFGACLDRLASLICDRLDARGCVIELPDVTSVCGESGAPALTADFDLTQGRKGRLQLGPHRNGAYAAQDALLLQSFADLLGLVCRLSQSARSWQQQALTDELTGLVNRRGLLLRLPEILARSRRQHTTVTLLLFDIDDFKHYNDAYSHDVGDEILRETGQLFMRSTRQHDIVARYGGDEFVVVFWEADEPRKVGSKPPRDVLAVLGRFRKTLERHQFSSLGPEAKGALTISGGLVTFPWDAITPDELISKADEALLLAKRQGKNRIWLIGHGVQ